MDYLYGELAPEQFHTMEQHLKSCALCAQKEGDLRKTLKSLDCWSVVIPPKPNLTPQWSPMVKWAAAAALLVTTAFATGRFTKQLDPQAIETQLAGPLQERIVREVDAKIREEVQLAAERSLEFAREKFQADLALKLRDIAERAQAEAAGTKEELTLVIAALQEQDKNLYIALQQIEAKRQADNRALRQDLEKVALFTDQSFRTAQRQLVQLASFNQSAE
jgi:hypothetical protein